MNGDTNISFQQADFSTLFPWPPPHGSIGNYLSTEPHPVAILPAFKLDSSGGYEYSGCSLAMQRCDIVDCIVTSTEIINKTCRLQMYHELAHDSSSPTLTHHDLFYDHLVEGTTSSVTKGDNTMKQNHGSEDSRPLSNDSNAFIESMNKTACRYSPKEKKERIERYKIKKNQRNFNKRIKYICRKTLADNRPRKKGRFVRNKEFEETNNINYNTMIGDGGQQGFGGVDDGVQSWMFNFSY